MYIQRELKTLLTVTRNPLEKGTRLKILFLLLSLTLSTSVLSNETQTPQLILLEWKSSEIVNDSEGNRHSMRDPLHKGMLVYPDGMPVEMKYVEVKRIKIKHIDANTFEIIED